MAYEIFGKKVTKAELKLVIKYPVQAVKVYKNAKHALAVAKEIYEEYALYLGNGDAFRHAYWNALNTRDVGEKKAKKFGDAHESEAPDGVDKNMDLYNNTVGREIGSKNESASDSKLKDIVISYCDQGKLYRIVNNQLVATDTSGKN